MTRILTPLAGGPGDEEAAAAAFAIAHHIQAFVEGLHVSANLALSYPVYGEGMGGGVTKELIEAAKEAADAQGAAAKSVFETAASAAAAPLDGVTPSGPIYGGRFVSVEGLPAEAISKHARLADLVVFSAKTCRPSSVLGDALSEVLLIERRPALIAPEEGRVSLDAPIAIAWDGSGEAASALLAARPFLARASMIHILQVENDIEFADRDVAACEAAADYIKLLGRSAEIERFARGEDTTAGAIQARVEALGAGLLVMGAYGHSRLREWITGGVTVRMLRESSIPLLLAH